MRVSFEERPGNDRLAPDRSREKKLRKSNREEIEVIEKEGRP